MYDLDDDAWADYYSTKYSVPKKVDDDKTDQLKLVKDDDDELPPLKLDINADNVPDDHKEIVDNFIEKLVVRIQSGLVNYDGAVDILVEYFGMSNDEAEYELIMRDVSPLDEIIPV